MKEILAPIFMAGVLTLGLAAPAEAHSITLHQGGDFASVLDGPGNDHNLVSIHDNECDGHAIRVEAILSDDSRYTIWNFKGCRKTEVSELNKGILSFRLCELTACTPWKNA